MRLTCPNCRAQYEVPDEVIPEEGRDVQCSNCEKTWFQEKHSKAEAETPEPAEAATEETAASEPMIEEPVAEEADPVSDEPEVQKDEPEVVVGKTIPVAEEVEFSAAVTEPEEATEPETVEEPEIEAEETEAEEPATDSPETPPEEPEAEIQETKAEDEEPEADETEAEEESEAEEAEAEDDEPATDEVEADEPETEEPPVAARETNLDPAVAGILQEEARREAELRAREAENLESQPDLGLDSQSEIQPEAVTPVATQTEPDSDQSDALPDVESINSTLSRDDGPAAPEKDEPAKRQSSGFLRGFALIVIIAVVLMLIYGNASQISEAVPQAEPVLGAYVSMIDQVRIWLESLAAGAQ